MLVLPPQTAHIFSVLPKLSSTEAFLDRWNQMQVTMLLAYSKYASLEDKCQDIWVKPWVALVKKQWPGSEGGQEWQRRSKRAGGSGGSLSD